MRRKRTLDDLLANTVACPTTGCLLWCGSTSGEPAPGKTGREYPRVSWGGRTHAVHRLVFVLTGNKLGPRDEVDHCCPGPELPRRLCVRPEHLQRASRLKNVSLRDLRRRRFEKEEKRRLAECPTRQPRDP